jgi:hypothetical protein
MPWDYGKSTSVGRLSLPSRAVTPRNLPAGEIEALDVQNRRVGTPLQVADTTD